MNATAAVVVLITFVTLGALLWALWRLLFPAPGRPMVCATCGHHGPTRQRTRGSMAIELVLWLAFILPGLLYSLWRLSTRRQVCAACGAETLIPPDSPMARRLLHPEK